MPVGVLVVPVIPGLTEHELPAILAAAARVGAQCAGYVTLRLPHGVAALFGDWLRQHAPTKQAKILQRIRALRGGQLNPSLTVARYMILRLFISMCYRWYPMYLGCLFCLFVYVEFFRIFLQ
jgi:DNA repair photolyase